MPDFEPVIGLEIHAQLLTASKIFCGCSTAFGAPPNTHICPVCIGLPGALPVLNRAAVDFAIRAALSGALDGVAYTKHPIFNLDIPTSCPDVPADVLNPRTTWTDGAAYDAQAKKLAAMFVENFKTFEPGVSAEVLAAGPRA